MPILFFKISVRRILTKSRAESAVSTSFRRRSETSPYSFLSKILLCFFAITRILFVLLASERNHSPSAYSHDSHGSSVIFLGKRSEIEGVPGRARLQLVTSTSLMNFSGTHRRVACEFRIIRKFLRVTDVFTHWLSAVWFSRSKDGQGVDNTPTRWCWSFR